MKKYDIILASQSPRRRELLAQGGYTFDIIPAKGEEKITCKIPYDVVMELSYQKADEILREHVLNNVQNKPVLIIGSDTVVAYNDQILGKPSSREDAIRTLQMLSGNTHQVYTGVALIYYDSADTSPKIETFYEKTDVTFYSLSDDEINQYVDSGDPFDKAGSYGIQGIFAKHVKKISGDYNNVVGLPLAAIYQRLKKYDI